MVEADEGGDILDSKAGTLYDVGEVTIFDSGWDVGGGEYLYRGGGGTAHTVDTVAVSDFRGKLNAESNDSSSSLFECACSVPYDEIGDDGREGENECCNKSTVGLCIWVPNIDNMLSTCKDDIARGLITVGPVAPPCVEDFGSDMESSGEED